MTKAELITIVAASVEGLTKKESGLLINTIMENIQNSIRKEEKFSYPGFGTFTMRYRKARQGIDPRTKEPIQIKASKTVGFKPAKAFKETL